MNSWESYLELQVNLERIRYSSTSHAEPGFCRAAPDGLADEPARLSLASPLDLQALPPSGNLVTLTPAVPCKRLRIATMTTTIRIGNQGILSSTERLAGPSWNNWLYSRMGPSMMTSATATTQTTCIHAVYRWRNRVWRDTPRLFMESLPFKPRARCACIRFRTCSPAHLFTFASIHLGGCITDPRESCDG